MSGFFQKMKEGASKAADKAQQAMEVQRMNAQISGARKDIEKLKSQIGETVYGAFAEGNLALAESEMVNLCRLIAQHETTIADVEARIKELRNQKDCPQCRNTVALDAKFCPDCGHKFELPPPPAVQEEAPPALVCASCSAELEEGSKFCAECGHPVG